MGDVALFADVRALVRRVGANRRLLPCSRCREVTPAVSTQARAQPACRLADLAGWLDGVAADVRHGVHWLRRRRPSDSSWQDECDHQHLDATAAEALARFVEEALWSAHKHGRPHVTLLAQY